ncbi:hypothetical protein H4582DRAFT_2060690 [Lactarius indigo]|nr:hypothetical protein H4582DRAFT_2060690 [Lactarius indigo]
MSSSIGDGPVSSTRFMAAMNLAAMVASSNIPQRPLPVCLIPLVVRVRDLVQLREPLQSQQASPKPQSMGPPSKQRSEASGVSTGFEFLSKVPSPVVPIPSGPRLSDTPRDDGKRKKRRTPSPPKDFMDRIPLSQLSPEIISIDDQPSDAPTAGAPTGSPTSAGLALSIADTMDVDDPGSSVQRAITPSQSDAPKRKAAGRSAPRARTGGIPPSTRTIKHRMGITIPASPLPEDLGNVESRIERCKLTLADVWDELTELRGRVQAINDSILKTLIDLENMAKYLE